MDPTYLGRPIPTPTAQQRRGPGLSRNYLIILVLIIALVAGALMLFASSDSSAVLQQRLSARQDTTLKIVADGQKNIASDDLAKLNSELSIVLSGDNATLQTALKEAGMKKVEKTITADEADATTFDQLRTAKLNAQYDDTYRRVLTQKLESLRGLVRELHDATKKRDLKAPLATEYQHLGLYIDALSKLEN